MAALIMSIGRFPEAVLAMKLSMQAGILFGTALVLAAIALCISQTRRPSRSNMSKAERAKEMKQAFQQMEKSNGTAEDAASIKVRRFCQNELFIC
jgi:type II secretory pathway component PulJ